jgi:predicted exporter
VGAEEIEESCEQAKHHVDVKRKSRTVMPLAVVDCTLAYDLTLFGPFAHVHAVFQAMVLPEALTSVEFWLPTPASKHRNMKIARENHTVRERTRAPKILAELEVARRRA